MRLTDAQIHQLIQAVSSFMQNGPAELRLYGTTEDIKLLILTDQTDFADNLMKLKPLILTSIKKHLGDQKINLKISAKEDVNQDPFLKMILPKSIVLYRWQ